METRPTELNITYFPYSFLEENDLKRLILYFNSIRLLQVLPDFDLGLPDPVRTSSLVQSFCPMSSSDLLETISRAHQSYHQFSSVHQDGGLIQLLRTYAMQEDFEHSRTGLVAEIRQGSPKLAPEELDLVNDALFLLFAHELDRDHLELDFQLDHVHGLETKLHEELGIGSEEEREAVALKSPLLLESDPPRTRYPLQRLRAWTRLYFQDQDPNPLLPLTTGLEVLEEISERLPSQLAALAYGPPSMLPRRYLLSIIPDPQLLSLEEILELRESLRQEGILEDWWDSLAAAIGRLERETFTAEQWIDVRQHLYEAADAFYQYWPGPGKAIQYLRLEAISYPEVQPTVAFSLTTGLQTVGPGLPTAKGKNGITLLLCPSAPPRDDRQ